MGIKRRYYMNYYNKRTTFARLTINGGKATRLCSTSGLGTETIHYDKGTAEKFFSGWEAELKYKGYSAVSQDHIVRHYRKIQEFLEEKSLVYLFGACDEEEYEFWAQQAKLIEQECPEVLKK